MISDLPVLIPQSFPHTILAIMVVDDIQAMAHKNKDQIKNRFKTTNGLTQLIGCPLLQKRYILYIWSSEAATRGVL